MPAPAADARAALSPPSRHALHDDQAELRCATDLLALSAEVETSQPYLTQFDSWGERIDKLVTCAEWRTQHGVSAEEGLIATGYERRWGARNRIVQFAKMYMFTPSSGLYNCPLAMTDGAARLCALLLDDSVKLSSAKQPLSAGARAAITDAYSHLTSRSPSSLQLLDVNCDRPRAPKEKIVNLTIANE